MCCDKCKYTMPYKEGTAKTCPSCADGNLRGNAEDWLSSPDLGLVKEIRPGQIALANIIEEAVNNPEPQIIIAQGGCGIGKAQPLTANILTPCGWDTMHSMRVGTPVVGQDGQTYRVTGVYPQGTRDTFEVTFTDGAKTECCDEHLWKVQSKKDRAKRRPGKVRALQDLVAHGLKTGREYNHWIPIMRAPEFESVALPLDPYLLGVLLGAACFRAPSRCTITKADQFVVDEIRRLLPMTDQLVLQKDGVTYAITARGACSNTTLKTIRQLNLHGKYSTEKHIPSQYLWTSVKNRLALLQGLLDTDDGMSGKSIEYSTSSPSLAEDIQTLVRSLGGVTTINSQIPQYTHNGEKRSGQRSYRLHPCFPPEITPFRLPRKARKYAPHTKYFPRRAIKAITYIGKKETQCISVSAPDQLYVTDDFIVTHNTFSYLVPSLLTKRRVIVSTAKKSLQGQLATKDLPYLREHLGRPRSCTSVKGRGNYLCKLYLRKNEKGAFAGDSAYYVHLDRFLSESPTGDLDSLPGGVRYPATLCTATECVGRSCTHASDCSFRKVKGRSREDDVVVVNHSLLGFDLKFGPQRLMGEYDILIIDEAHAAEDYFRNAFTYEVSTAWMKGALQDLHKQNIALTKGLTAAAAKRTWKAIFDNVPRTEVLSHGFFGDLTAVRDTLTLMLRSVNEHVSTYWPELTNVNLGDAERAAEILDEIEDDSRNEVLICTKVAEKISAMQETLLATEDPDDNMVRVRQEHYKKDGFKVVIKPIDIGRLVGPKLSSIKTVILTSATLHADLLERDLGIKANVVVNEPSPFDYKANGLVYIPKTVPNPATAQAEGRGDEWVEETAKQVVQLVRASNGNGLVLFTSLKEMSNVLGHIDQNYELEQPIFAQEIGRRPDEVFAEFLETDNAVLFGSKSFFEGIDVQGDKLRLVVLTKLPFPIWGDPIVQAKKDQMGSKHFAHYYLPKMFVDLMQAAGRLIRTQTDRGVFAILDVRMWVGSNKKINPEHVKISNGTWPGYGSKAFRQLPFSNVTPNFSLAQRFLAHIQKK